MSRANPRKWREMTAEETRQLSAWLALADCRSLSWAQAVREREEARELPITIARLALERQARRRSA